MILGTITARRPRPRLEPSVRLDAGAIGDVDGTWFPVWTPSLGRAKPPFPLVQREVKGGIEHKRALTAKQYQQSSQLNSVLNLSDIHDESYKPLLPIDLPAIQRLVTSGVPRSDSEGAVTSRNLPAKEGERAMAKKTPYGDTELETMLEETLQEGGKAEEVTGDARELEASNVGAVGEEATRIALETMGYDSLEALLMASKGTNGVQNQRRGRSRGRKGVGGIAGGSKPKVADVLNPNSPVYHAAFAKAYQQARDSLLSADSSKRKAAALEAHTSLPGHRWSSISASDHTWYLKNQGMQLVGSAAERFATLHARVLLEREQYWKMIHSEALQHRVRFDYLSERQRAQFHSDDEYRRRRVFDLPRYYRALSMIRLLSDVKNNPGVLELRRFLRSTGEPQAFGTPVSQLGPCSVPLPGYKFYLPAVDVSPVDAWAEDSIGYRKKKTAEVWDDVTMKDIVVNEVMMKDEGSKGVQIGKGTVPPAANVTVAAGAAAGAIACLLRSGVSKGRQPWEIPVVITSGEIPGSQKTMKTIYLGKPFLARKEGLREKQRRLQKYAALTALSEVRLDVERPNDYNPTLRSREARYSLWRVGNSRIGNISNTFGESWSMPLVVRSHARMTLPSSNTPTITDVAFAVKTEYLPEPDMEEDTAEELTRWWSKLLVNQNSVDALLVGHAHVPRATLIATRLLSEKSIREEIKDALQVENGFSFVAAVLAHLAGLESGNYVLIHAGGGQDKTFVWQAIQEDIPGIPVDQAPPLPLELTEQQVLDADVSNKGLVVDLHAAHTTSGAVDTSVNPFIPPKWRPYREDVAQIPYTFPPATFAKRPRSEKSKGPKKRSRSLAWQGDMDRVQHIGTLSRAEYAAGLEEEL